MPDVCYLTRSTNGAGGAKIHNPLFRQSLYSRDLVHLGNIPPNVGKYGIKS